MHIWKPNTVTSDIIDAPRNAKMRACSLNCSQALCVQAEPGNGASMHGDGNVLGVENIWILTVD